MADMDNMRMDKRVTEYLAWLNNQFEKRTGRGGFRCTVRVPRRTHGRLRPSRSGLPRHLRRQGTMMRKQKRKHIMSETDTGNTQIDKRVECVVLPGDRRSGISCDWANATKETDE